MGAHRATARLLKKRKTTRKLARLAEERLRKAEPKKR